MVQIPQKLYHFLTYSELKLTKNDQILTLVT